eukprot:2867262-Amphidinium_carterae.1
MGFGVWGGREECDLSVCRQCFILKITMLSGPEGGSPTYAAYKLSGGMNFCYNTVVTEIIPSSFPVYAELI